MRALEAEFGRVAASSAAFADLVASVQREGARVEREVQLLKERVGQQERRVLERRVERIEAAALSQERRLSNCAALIELEPADYQDAKKQKQG